MIYPEPVFSYTMSHTGFDFDRATSVWIEIEIGKKSFRSGLLVSLPVGTKWWLQHLALEKDIKQQFFKHFWRTLGAA